MQYKAKLIVGFRRDQEHTIDADEAHKAYFLFLNPEHRGVFSNGLAIKGDQIQEIVPDYNATMGWNPIHQLDTDDWSELRAKGIEKRIRDMLAYAKEVAQRGDEKVLSTPLTQLRQLEKKEVNSMPLELSGKLKKLYDSKNKN